MHRRTFLGGLSLLTSVGLTSVTTRLAFAQENYPSRPVQIVVAIQAGGSVDLAGRLAADALSAQLGQNFVVENVPGAGGQIGMTKVANAAADGYELLFGTAGPIVILPQRESVLAELNPLEAFVPVALLYSVPLVIICKKGRFASMQEMIDYAKSNPGQVTFGSTGVGSINHVVGELFASVAGVELLHIPYSGSAPVITDMIGGRIDLYFATLPSWKSSSDDLDVLAVAAKERSAFAPELPTALEQGLEGFEFSNWGGVFAPAGTPQAVVDKLEATLRTAMDDAAIREKFTGAGNEPNFVSGEEAKAAIAAEFDRLKTLVAERKLNLNE